MEYNYRPLKKSDLSDLTAFLDTVFEIKNNNQVELVQWKYFHPFFHEETFQFGAFTLDSSRKLVAHYANLPLQVSCKSETYQAAICSDMATHPDFRGQGLISNLSKRTYEAVRKSQVQVSIGFSNEAGVQVDAHSKGYGYAIVGQFASFRIGILKKVPCEFLLTEIKSFEQEISFEKSPFFAIKKTMAYLNWRYRDRPNNQYLLYKIVTSDQLIGYAVLKQGGMQLHVVDLIMADPISDLKEIIHSLVNLAFNKKKQFLTFSVLENTFWHDVFKGMLLFNLRMKQGSYYLTVKNHSLSPGVQEKILQKDNWLCFAGDIL